MATPKLFTPLTLGGKKDPVQLLHRVVMAPLTRLRAGEDGVQPQIAAEYYTQRSTPGGLLIAEATNIIPTARGYYGAPGLFTAEQVDSWKPVTDAVHAKGGKIFVQLWHTGRVGHPFNQPGEQLPVSSSTTPFPEKIKAFAVTRKGRQSYLTPRALETAEIPAIVESYRIAAINAIAAGFDGVEIHSANGYLLEQFLCDNVNKRTDKYGGSLENRARFIFEVLDAITSSVDSSKVGIRLSPFGLTFGATDSNPEATYSYVINKLNAYDLAYLHVVEPGGYHAKTDKVPASGITPLFRKVYKGVYMTSSGFTRDKAVQVVQDGTADAVAVGRAFISNPDLVKRYELNLPLSKDNRSTYYLGDRDLKHIAEGYTDYPFYDAPRASL